MRSTGPGISLVEAALAAVELGAKALHDPTEGGLSGGLFEMAAAAEVRIRVDRGCSPLVRARCRVSAGRSAAIRGRLSPRARCSPRFRTTSPTTAVATLRERGHRGGRHRRGRGRSGGRATPTGEAYAWPERDELARLFAAR